MYLGGQEPGMLGKGQPYWKWKQSMGMESSLQTAASQEGLQIWRVEKMKLVSVPRKDYGTFFTGDAYLVLYSQDEERHLHIWHGEKASIDEKGASALFATQLDTTLGGKPIQHREVQGNESDTFMGYFPSGIRYQEGGVESGFQNVSEGQALSVRHLYHVKGKRNVRVWEVETSWGSFNTGDCFILDLGQTIYQWCGSQANIHEKQKAMEFANSIRDLERRGKAQVVMVTDGEEPEGMMEVLGPKPSLKEGSAQGDAQADVTHSQMASLSKVSDATGSMTLTQVSAQNPFPKTMLQSEDCFVLDNGVCGKIYVWKGRGANSEEKRAALKVAEAVISQRHYPANTQVEIIPEGLESAFFKQFFKGWN